jgi:hypothetical protein
MIPLPFLFLATLLLATLLAYLIHLARRRSLAARVRQLAQAWGMNYSETDRFQITARVADRFPIPGASDLTIVDLIYRVEGDRYRYLFTVAYTVGVVRTKRRKISAAAFSEPRDRSGPADDAPVVLGPPATRLLDQYAALRAGGDGATATPSHATPQVVEKVEIAN